MTGMRYSASMMQVHIILCGTSPIFRWLSPKIYHINIIEVGAYPNEVDVH